MPSGGSAKWSKTRSVSDVRSRVVRKEQGNELIYSRGRYQDKYFGSLLWQGLGSTRNGSGREMFLNTAPSRISLHGIRTVAD